MQNSLSNFDFINTTKSSTSARQDCVLLLTDPGTTAKYENLTVAKTADDITKSQNIVKKKLKWKYTKCSLILTLNSQAITMRTASATSNETCNLSFPV